MHDKRSTLKRGVAAIFRFSVYGVSPGTKTERHSHGGVTQCISGIEVDHGPGDDHASGARSEEDTDGNPLSNRLPYRPIRLRKSPDIFPLLTEGSLCIIPLVTEESE